MTQEDEINFENATNCTICGDIFSNTSGKARDHCPVSGKFRGAACSDCNLNFQQPTFIPVFFHNLRGFDSHLLMKGIGLFKNKRINVIPNNMEKYISFSLGSLRFIDCFQFLPYSLAVWQKIQLTKTQATLNLWKKSIHRRINVPYFSARAFTHIHGWKRKQSLTSKADHQKKHLR